ncbi:MAG: DNA translocase FtsK 4TM domain-containing protein, partial [Methylophilaceae bacterium]|nr:DNA translocase FtsK 4TM domain-containing protein [Methylophilaceae bacterium]
MFFKKNSSADTAKVEKKVEAPKSAKQLHHVRLIREAWWLSLVLIGLYLAVILGSYHSEDPSWFYLSSTDRLVQNAGGKVGSILSDILLNVFGFSAWWLDILAFFTIWLMYQQIETEEKERPFLAVNMIGFGLLLNASSALEAGHLISFPATLPDAAGGILGQSVDGLLRSMFAFAGSTMVLLLLFAVGFSLFTGWSWIMMTEKLGAALILTYEWVDAKYHDWQDRRVGKVVEQKRAEFVMNERKRTEDRSPIEIRPAEIEVVKSDRVLKEKQVPLFESDEHLPPL